MKQDVSIGLIGAGRIGRMHAKLLQRSVDGVRVVRVSDVFTDAAKSCAAEEDIPAWSDRPDDVFDDPAVDAVMICSSTDTHADMIQRAAKAGKHIFCEKPIAYDIDLIIETLDVVKKAGAKLQIGFNRRFDPNFARVAEIVRKGEIGEVHTVRITSRDPAPPPIDYIKRSGGLFYDMTIHDFDMARFLSGSEVKEVYAVGAVLVDNKIGEVGDIDTTVINLVFENGALGIIENSRKAVFGYDQRVEVFGSAGMADAANVATNSVTVSTAESLKQDLPPFFFIERYTDAYINELDHFISSLREDKEPSVTGRDGLEPVYMAAACMRSLKEKRPVSMNEVKK